jgi:histidine triad (HIT) family protein
MLYGLFCYTFAMDDCIFCKIVAGTIPARNVYEDEHHLAFLDISPCNIGHVQVIPKQHYRWVWDHPNIGDYMSVAQKIVRAQKKAFNTDWVVSVIAGEEVPHAHIWLVPRFSDDGHGGFLKPENIKDLSDEEINAAATSIRTALE